jgi:3-dehydro-L-gulonate 2-dehydrogenase
LHVAWISVSLCASEKAQGMEQQTIRIPVEQAKEVFRNILIKHGVRENDALICAGVFAENSLDGIYSHGFNRFPRFIHYLKEGYVKPDKTAECVHRAGGMEQWNGHLGPGPLNALICTDRSIALAREHGIGCVALANTNHWMRGGTYGWRAVNSGFVLIAWSNTIANMPPWGSRTAKLGNNPLVIAVPNGNEPLVLDMAMSQYSYGALEIHKMKDQKLSVAGGFDNEGNLSVDPTMIMNSRRPLPIGYWKGSGLSLLLDVLAAILSSGLSTSLISKQKAEYGLSQIFIAIDISKLSNFRFITSAIDQILQDYREATPDEKGKAVRSPGEQVVRIRDENTRLGIPIPKKLWDEIQEL